MIAPDQVILNRFRGRSAPIVLEFFKKWWANWRDWWANWPTSTLLKKRPARNFTDCILFKISKIVIGPKYNSQVTNYKVCLCHGTIKNGIKGWHILLNILILCQNSLAKPHSKFFSEPQKKLYGNQSQFRFLSQLH